MEGPRDIVLLFRPVGVRVKVGLDLSTWSVKGTS